LEMPFAAAHESVSGTLRQAAMSAQWYRGKSGRDSDNPFR
jgi:hypothetical protein